MKIIFLRIALKSGIATGILDLITSGSTAQKTSPRLDRVHRHKQGEIKCGEMGLPPLLLNSANIPPTYDKRKILL
jgi:hypothetical protein